jgi:hypothetical protein
MFSVRGEDATAVSFAAFDGLWLAHGDRTARPWSNNPMIFKLL